MQVNNIKIYKKLRMRNLKSNNPENSDSFSDKTLEEYKNDYPDLIEYYKKRHIDNDEINFIEVLSLVFALNKTPPYPP